MSSKTWKNHVIQPLCHAASTLSLRLKKWKKGEIAHGEFNILCRNYAASDDREHFRGHIYRPLICKHEGKALIK